MNKFVKVTDNNGDDVYFRLDTITAINVNRNIVHCDNGDVFWLAEGAIDELINSIEVI